MYRAFVPDFDFALGGSGHFHIVYLVKEVVYAMNVELTYNLLGSCEN